MGLAYENKALYVVEIESSHSNEQFLTYLFKSELSSFVQPCPGCSFRKTLFETVHLYSTRTPLLLGPANAADFANRLCVHPLGQGVFSMIR